MQENDQLISYQLYAELFKFLKPFMKCWIKQIFLNSLAFFISIGIGWNVSLSTAKADNEGSLSFSASGFVESHYYNDGNPVESLTNAFQYEFADGKYSIYIPITSRLKILEDSDIIAYTCVFDGTNSYNTVHLSTNPVTHVAAFQNGKLVKRELKTPVRADNDATLKIGLGPIPPFPYDAPMITIWAGLASQSYYKGNAELYQKALVPLDSELEKEQTKFNIIFKKNDKLSGFLERLEEYYDGPEKGGQLQKALPLENRSYGFTNLVFSTTEWSDVSGCVFPKHMQLQLFRQDSSGKVRTAVLYAVNVTQVDLGRTTSSFTPNVKPRTRVIDETLGKNEKRTYNSITGKLLRPDELTRHSERTISTSQKRPVEFKRTKREIFFKVMFALVLFSPVILLIYKLKSKNNS